jgi:5'-nucleotidase (lipoprotein e(P4) family)
MRKAVYLFAVVLLFSACQNQTIVTLNSSKNKPTNDYMTMAVLYRQQAAENRALYYQAFNFAKMIFDQGLQNKSVKKERAVIVDIDETVLDNSPYQAQCILKNINYPEDWDKWCNMAKADALPGAVDFLNYVKEKKAVVFYVTNRRENLRAGTLKNLADKGFPYADNDHLMMKTDSTNKEKYRNRIAKTCEIALLMGDNLADFTSVFGTKPNTERNRLADSLKNVFGNRFILLPNAMYGDWENAFYPKDSKNINKDSLRKTFLKGF